MGLLATCIAQEESRYRLHGVCACFVCLHVLPGVISSSVAVSAYFKSLASTPEQHVRSFDKPASLDCFVPVTCCTTCPPHPRLASVAAPSSAPASTWHSHADEFPRWLSRIHSAFKCSARSRWAEPVPADVSATLVSMSAAHASRAHCC